MNTVIVNGVNITEDNERLKKELNELKRDVARFMELLSKENTTNKEGFEVVTLGEKLSKVGKQE